MLIGAVAAPAQYGHPLKGSWSGDTSVPATRVPTGTWKQGAVTGDFILMRN